MPSGKNVWDTELYEAQHAFVWQLAEDLIKLLDPKPGERILDVGCGTGQLTQQIAAAGANVLGVDSSPDMIGQARQNYPAVRFLLQDAASMTFDGEFDAVFSNAALHWILDAHGAAKAMARALRPAGRFVAELGGRGNIGSIEQALKAMCRRYSVPVPPRRTFFPSISEYTGVLETSGFEVRSAMLFDRPTKLEGERGMEQWLEQFSSFYFDQIPAQSRQKAMKEAVEDLRAKLYREGVWRADYRRLRILANKI